MLRKHIYTCPDVIYIRNRQKKILIANFGIGAFAALGLWAYGTYLERKERRELIESHQNHETV